MVAPLPTNSISSVVLSLPDSLNFVVLDGILTVYVVPEDPPAAVCTKAVVAICVVFVPAVAVGARGVPVNVGLVNIVAFDSFVTFPRPTIALLIPLTVPENVVVPSSVIFTS